LAVLGKIQVFSDNCNREKPLKKIGFLENLVNFYHNKQSLVEKDAIALFKYDKMKGAVD